MVTNRKLSLIIDSDGESFRHEMASVLTDGPCRLVWRTLSTGAQARAVGKIDVLVCPFLASRKLMRKQLADESLTLCGLDSKRLLAIHEVRWDRSRWSRGAYPVMAPGVLNPHYERILHGTPPIFFAGDHAIAGYAGYMEGALRSAEHTAECVRDFLNNRTASL